MLDTRLSDMEKYPLKLGDLIVMSCSATDAPEKPIWAAGTTNILNDVPCVGLNGDTDTMAPLSSTAHGSRTQVPSWRLTRLDEARTKPPCAS